MKYTFTVIMHSASLPPLPPPAPTVGHHASHHRKAPRVTLTPAGAACFYDAFGDIGTTLPEKIGRFHLSSRKLVPISPSASHRRAGADRWRGRWPEYHLSPLRELRLPLSGGVGEPVTTRTRNSQRWPKFWSNFRRWGGGYLREDVGLALVVGLRHVHEAEPKHHPDPHLRPACSAPLRRWGGVGVGCNSVDPPNSIPP
jgi:hypothetical protein